MTSLAQLIRQSDGTARRDIEVLLGAALGVTRTYLYAHPEMEPESHDQQRIEVMLDAYRAGMPVAYIIGHRHFWDLELTVSPDVLIPRQETELLVELALDHLPTGARVLDLGTGSGAIALAIARQRPDVQMTATDVSTAAICVARRNAENLQVRVEWKTGSWYEAVSGCFDLIASNPPYISEHDPHLQSLAREPRIALVAGTDGLDALRCVVGEARAHLVPGGLLLVEHGFDQGSAVRALFAAARFQTIATLPDLAGRERVTWGRR